MFGFAEQHQQLVIGAHLVWDEGFGEGWPEDDLWELDEPDAAELLFGTAAWSAATAAASPAGSSPTR